MKKLIYIHGTNGAGKSTLALRLLDLFGKGKVEQVLQDNHKARITRTNTPGIVFAGKYDNACGGVDGFSPYASLLDVLDAMSEDGESVICEGLITPGLDTCKAMAAKFDKAIFIHLATPIETCISQVKQRRAKAGNDKPYDPTNLYKKRNSSENWSKRLKQAGLEMHDLTFDEAYKMIAEALEGKD